MTEQRFTISVPDEALEDLHRRLRQTRWPDTEQLGLDVRTRR